MELRKDIDKLDDEIVELLRKRIEIVKKIGEIKKEKGIPMRDKQREAEIIERLKLDKDFAARLYNVIFEYSEDITK